MITLGQKLKIQKTCVKRFYKNIRLVLCKKPLQKTPNIREMGPSTLWLFCEKKNCSKRHQIFEKRDHFENQPSCKGNTLCKGYSLCKLLSLGQKSKMPKTCKKPFFKKIRVVLCKTPLQKTQNIQEMRSY